MLVEEYSFESSVGKAKRVGALTRVVELTAGKEG